MQTIVFTEPCPHARDFSLESGNEAVAKQLIDDYRDADLSEAARALCDYAVKLTLSPGEMQNLDVEMLRSHGFDDEQIHMAAQVIAYFNYINRIADGLGVELEEWMEGTAEEWMQRKAKFD